jgi:hypothetical protein
LYVLGNDAKWSQGQEAYAPYFPKQCSGARWFGEKTPSYSVNRVAMFRARVWFGPRMKVFITWRDPMQVLSARYLMIKRRLKGKRFAEWAIPLVSKFRDWLECRDRLLQPLDLTERMLYDPSVLSLREAAAIEEDVSGHCGSTPPKVESPGIIGPLEGPLIFQRWTRVLGLEQVLCILLDDQSRHRDLVYDRVANFLAVDRKGFGFESNTKSKSGGKPLNSTFIKLADDQQESFGESELAKMRDALDAGRRLAEERRHHDDKFWLDEFCKLG